MTNFNITIELSNGTSENYRANFNLSTDVEDLKGWVSYLLPESARWVIPNLIWQAFMVADGKVSQLHLLVPDLIDPEAECEVFTVTQAL